MVKTTTILLVEDDALLADCYRRWLTGGGYKIQHASDAQTALDILDEHPPQVILLDLLLPGANGIQFLHMLRSHADLAHIPIIMCSNALPDSLPDMLPYGVRGTLDKATLTRERLCAAIAEVL
jgi:CheY-like chemotaxis protein